MSRMFFSGFLFISTHISLDLLSLGSAEARIGWGGKLNGHLMASYVGNICEKNYQNLLIGFQITVENVEMLFGTQCISFFFFFLANSCQSVAILMTCRHMSLSLAFLQTVWTPKFWGWTSLSTVLSQVVLGRPAGLLQSAGGWSAVDMMRW